MNIKKLSLYNFRNFIQAEVSFPEDAFLIAAAPNATGKTNFLESIVMLLRGKSFRASNDECIRWQQDNFIIQGQIKHQGSTSDIAMRYHQPTRKLRVDQDGVPISPVTFYANYPLILFLPEDTFIFSRGPAQRRNFINRILVGSPSYVSALVQYQRVLKQRNVALKTASSFTDVLVWTELLTEHGATLWSQRRNLASFFNTHLSDLYSKISNEQRKFTVNLQANITAGDNFTSALEKVFSYEKRYGYTLYGPHRDDLQIITEGKDISSVLSQGQTRSLIIALKIAAHRYVEKITKQRPLFLLDEALSELDNKRQAALLANLPDTQIILTCTSVPTMLRSLDNIHLLNIESILSSPKKDKKVRNNEPVQLEAKPASEPEEVESNGVTPTHADQATPNSKQVNIAKSVS